MAGYTRQSTFADGDTITAALFNNEFNQLLNAFGNTSGHKHDGTANEGPVIGLIGDAGETSPNNKVLIDTTNNYIEFYVEVSSAPVQQLYIADGAIIPVTDNDIDLGTSSLEFKDIYIDGTATIDTLTVDEAATVGTTLGVTGATTLSSTLAVTGATTLSSTLAVTGTSTLTGNVTATNDLSVGGNLTVTGNATISGNLTFGDADTDSINLAAEIDSHIVPNTDDTYDLGTSTKQWRNLYIDGTAEIDTLAIDGTTVTSTAAELNILDGVTSTAAELNILDGVTATATEINLLDGVTSTTAELNILDGVTATAAEINTLDGITSTVAELNILDGVTASATDINLIDGITNGTVIASKAIVTDANKDISGGRNITITGELDAATLDISGNADIDGTLETDALSINGTTVTSTAAELNILDGVTSTAAELNLLDGVTATTAELNILDGVTSTAAELNILDGKAFLDEDDMSSNSATGIASQQSIKAYVDTTVAATNEVVEDSTPQLGGDLDLNSNDITGTGNINITGTIQSSGNITGTLATAAQGNITSLGTLTGLTVSGDANFDSGTLFVDVSTNQVGIGTTDPSADALGSADDLVIKNAASAGLTIKSADSGNQTIALGASSDEDYGIIQGFYNSGSPFIRTSISGTEVTKVTSSGLDVTGSVTADGLTVDDITINGSTISDAGDLDFDVGGDIILNADGGDIRFRDGATEVGSIVMDDGSNTFILKSAQSDADIKFNGNDGGSGVTALTLDMSDAGTAIFNHDITLPDSGQAIFGASSDLQIFHDQANSINYIKSFTSNELRLESNGNTTIRTNNGDNMAVFTKDGAATLYHDNNPKIATTSTGIDVTGDVIIQDGTPTLEFKDTDNNLIASVGGASGSLLLKADTGGGTSGESMQFHTGATERLRIDASGAMQIGGTTNAGFLDFDSTSLQLNTQRNPNTGTFVNTGKAHASITMRGDNGSSNIKFGTATANNTVATTRLEIGPTEMVVNDLSNDYDFRVESNGNTHMLFVDGANNAVHVGGMASEGAGAQFNISNGSAETLEYFVGSGSNTNIIQAYNRSTSNYTIIDTRASEHRFRIATAELLNVTSAGVILNEDSGDRDFRVESNNNSHMLFVDGGNDVVCIGGSTVESGDHLEVLSSDTTTNVRIRNTNSGAAAPALIFDKASGSPADDDEVGLLNFVGQDSNNNAEVYAQIVGIAADVTSGTEDGKLTLGTAVSGSFNTTMTIADGAATFSGALTSKSHVVTGIDNNAFEVKTNHSGNPSALRVAGAGSINGISGTFQSFYPLNVMQDSGALNSIYAAGNIKTDGNINIGTSGKGISFGATSDAAGMTSELLDDYEEGTWTPAYSSNGGLSTVTGITSASGEYVKIGQFVHITGQFTLNGSSGTRIQPGDFIRITGLPFNKNDRYSSGTVYTTRAFSNLGGFTGAAYWYASSYAVIQFLGQGNTTWSGDENETVYFSMNFRDS